MEIGDRDGRRRRSRWRSTRSEEVEDEMGDEK